MKKLLLIFLLSTFVFSAFSQKYDSLIFKNGKKINVTILGEGNDFIGYKLPNSSEWLITSKAELSQVITKDGKTIYPKSDTTWGEDVSNDPAVVQEIILQEEFEESNNLPVREEPEYRDEPIYRHESQPNRYSQYSERRELPLKYNPGWNENFEEVIYLKNGSVIRGIVLEHIPNQDIKIQTADGSIFVYQADEVDRITKVSTGKVNRSGYAMNSFENKGLRPGYKGIVELGYAIGDFDRFKFHFINAYQFNPFISLGLGTGFHYYDKSILDYYPKYHDDESWIIPFFADFRANFLDGPISPYLSMEIGYSFNASDDFKGEGFLLNPTVGVSFRVAEKTTINVGIGYDLQMTRGASDHCSGTSINLGISF